MLAYSVDRGTSSAAAPRGSRCAARTPACPADPFGPIRAALVTEHVEMARRIAGKMARRLPAALADDVQSAALLGLVEAASRFELGRGESFTAFAAKRVRGAVLDELRRGDVLPRRVRQTARRTREVVRRLEHELGRAPRDEEVACRLGVDLEEYRDRIAGLEVVEVVSSGEVAGVPDTRGEDPAELTDRARTSARVASARRRLDRREAIVLSMLYDEGKTLAEIGRELGVTESRACQLHTRALRRVRAELGMAEPARAPAARTRRARRP